MGTYSSKDVNDETGVQSIPTRGDRENVIKQDDMNFPPTYVMVSLKSTLTL